MNKEKCAWCIIPRVRTFSKDELCKKHIKVWKANNRLICTGCNVLLGAHNCYMCKFCKIDWCAKCYDDRKGVCGCRSCVTCGKIGTLYSGLPGSQCSICLAVFTYRLSKYGPTMTDKSSSSSSCIIS